MKKNRFAALTLSLVVSVFLFTGCEADSEGNPPDLPGDTTDTTTPLPGDSGQLTVESISATSLVLRWTVATDETTSQGNLQYAVFISSSDNINTIAACKTNGSTIKEFTANLLSFPVSGLTADTTYYFNVIVKDESGNEAVYIALSQSTGSAPDSTPPVPGSGGTLSSGEVHYDSFDITWDPATDDITNQSNLQYVIYLSDSNNINTVSGCETYGTMIGDYATDITSGTATDLQGDTLYYFNVVVKDSAGNKSVYSMSSQQTPEAPDITAPVPGNNGIISKSRITSTSVSLSWTKATDDVTDPDYLEYEFYSSTSADIDSVEHCLAKHAPVFDTFLTTNIDMTGLNPGTTYYYNILVRDEAGNISAYTMVEVTTASAR